MTPYFFTSVFLAYTLLFTTTHASSKPDVPAGYKFTLAVPTEHSPGFVGRAYLMENSQVEPSFRVALSVGASEAGNNYSCSLEVFIGDVKVWSSGHYSRFHVSDTCVLELTPGGDLRLKGPNGEIGWRTGTSRQNVERLQIQRTGNLVLVDALNNIKWQSFNFPTDVMVWGQRLDVATRLTSYPRNSDSSFYYTFEIRHDRVALYLNSGPFRYSYWELSPSDGRDISFVQFGPRGLELLDLRNKKIAQILPSRTPEADGAPRFLALSNGTGNMGLYYYNTEDKTFTPGFEALSETCDLPTACKPYGICSSNACSCIRLGNNQSNSTGQGSGCGDRLPADPCDGGGLFEMLELDGVGSVLRGGPERANVSKDECAGLCLEDCTCLAALYDADYDDDARGIGVSWCYFYGVTVGIRQVDAGRGSVYMVKVPKGTKSGNGKSNPKKWVLVLVGVADGIVIVAVLGGMSYYLIWKRRRNSNTVASPTNNR